ncbi:MAG: hypothetical protein IJK87_14290 [Prevotella sp.]|nr:hypothetical protein [Prevotella sp.]
MKRFIERHGMWVSTLALGVCAFLFWWRCYPCILTYHEQYQLFLFDSDYFIDRITQPGGLARYIGEFFVQFYNHVMLGAFIVSLFYMVIQRLVWMIISRHIDESQPYQPLLGYILSFIPPLILWLLMGDESLMMTYVVSFTLALLAILSFPSNKKLRIVWVIIVLPLLYWLIGPMVMMVAVYALPLISIPYLIACVLAFSHVAAYPLSRLVQGIDYYRLIGLTPLWLVLLPMFTILIIVILILANSLSKKGKKMNFYLWMGLAISVIYFYFLSPHTFQSRKYELIEYDYLVRIGNWDGIIAKAEKKQPDLPMSVCATNLALGMNGQLGERAFDFFQHGMDGLLPPLERNFSSTLITAEAYFHLGLVNTAQRYAFEAMEAIPNNNKSARVVKRLVETNLINGQYDVARKYILILQKTAFYGKWASRLLPLLGNEKAIEAHPLYGYMRRVRLVDDFLFSEHEADKICGQLFLRNKQNRLAMQYLLLAPLLQRDMDKFMQYAELVRSEVHYNPLAAQEALAFVFMRQNQRPPLGLVSPSVMERFQSFARDYSTYGANPSALEHFHNTTWYYLCVK